MSFVTRSPGPFSSEPKFPPVFFLLQCPSCPLPNSTPHGLPFLTSSLHVHSLTLPSHLSLIPPLAYVLLTFSLARNNLVLHACLLVCKNEVQQTISLNWLLDHIQKLSSVHSRNFLCCFVLPAALRVI